MSFNIKNIAFFLLVVLIALSCTDRTADRTPEGYILSAGNMTIVVNDSTGARIISFRLDDNELLGTTKEHPRFYGSTLWLSPEGKWKGQGILDNGVYRIDKYNSEIMQLTSQTDTVNGFVFTKNFSADPADTSILIRYTITNTSGETREVAPWEVTRVPTGGLAFIPKGSEENIPVSNKMYPLLSIVDTSGTIWYPADTSKISAQKLFMDGGEGWMAYARNNAIFIKKVPVFDPGLAAPNEKNVEVYVNRDKTYIELENQGIFQKLEPGESLNYDVTWYARYLPEDLSVTTGSEKLLSFVRNVINNGR